MYMYIYVYVHKSTRLLGLVFEEGQALRQGPARGEAREVHGAERVGGVAAGAVEEGLVAVVFV